MCEKMCTFAAKYHTMNKLIDITDSEQAELALEFAESIHAGFPSPSIFKITGYIHSIYKV